LTEWHRKVARNKEQGKHDSRLEWIIATQEDIRE
jgi:hypothetical protein